MNDHSPQPGSATPQAGEPRRGLARLLASLAGSPAGVRRKGSFLVIVVGTLALLSVFTILYVAIGNQDVRTRAAVLRRESLDDVPDQVRDYIAGIIANDVTALQTDPALVGRVVANGLMFARETTDYPVTSWDARADVPTNATGNLHRAIFSPAGAYPAAADNATARWLPSDPWLAASAPTWLNFAAAPPTNPAQPFLDERDWSQVSNIAPDGMPVNLYNLRGNWNASHARMVTNLTQPAGGTMTDFGVNVGSGVNYFRPAAWFGRQVGAFMPVGATLGLQPNNPAYPANQWADADGDGMRESRWTELREYANRANISAVGADNPMVEHLESRDAQFRWFVATRIVDLSSAINVNVAADFRAAPNASAPVGTGGPAEIDLLRLLSMSDIYDVNGPAGGVNGLPAPGAGIVAGDYTGHNGTPVAASSGERAYEALRLSIASGMPVPRATPDGTALFDGSLTPGLETWMTNSQSALSAPSYKFFADAAGAPNFPLRRRTFWENAARTSAGSRGSPGEYTAPFDTNDFPVRLYGTFDVTAQAELLTYWGSNNPATTSTLESALGGRFNALYSPLRDNGLEGSTERNGLFTANPSDPNALRQAAADIRRHLTTVSGARRLRGYVPGVDPGSLSQAELQIDALPLLQRGQASDVQKIYAGYADALAPYALSRDAWTPGSGPFGALSTTFYGYSGPQTALLTAAHMAVNMKDLYDYDYPQGTSVQAEQPGTFNAFASPLPRSDPRSSLFTLVLSNNFVNRVAGRVTTNPEYFPAIDPGAGVFPGRTPRRDFLDLNYDPARASRTSTVNRLANAPSDVAAPLVNVYGIEPQPFITNVTSIAVYTDAPPGAGGDTEASGEEITIDPSIDAGNSDFLFRALAVQITNPTDFAIDLTSAENQNPSTSARTIGGDANSSNDTNDDTVVERHYYYLRLEQAGAAAGQIEEKFFLAADFDPAVPDNFQNIRVQPRSSVVVMILSQAPSDILARARRCDAVAFPLALTADQMLRRYIGNSMGETSSPNVGPPNRLGGVYWTREIGNIADFTLAPAAFSRVINDYSGTSPVVQPVVELWRSRTKDRPTSLPGQAPANLGDQLIDRMRMPDTAILDRRLKEGGDIEITGTDADTDDTGYTVTVWASVRRPSDPPSGAVPPGGFSEPLGAYPAFCMEPKYRTDWNLATKDGLNASTASAEVDDLRNTDFLDNDLRRAGCQQSLNNWTTKMVHPVRRLVPALAKYPGNYSPSDLFAGETYGHVDRASHQGAFTPVPPATGYRDLYPVFTFDNTEFQRLSVPGDSTSAKVSGLRAQDMLLPWGIGPMFAPMDASGTIIDDRSQSNITQRRLGRERAWTTLAEAAAMANGYQFHRTSVAADIAAYFPANNPDPLRAYIPHNQNGNWAPILDRGHLVLDQYTPFLDEDGDKVFAGPVQGGQDTRVGMEIPPAMAVLDTFCVLPPTVPASLTTLVPGLVNVNTAPLPVMRCMPMLSPMKGNLATGPSSGTANWWGTGTLDLTADIAATLVSYRDRRPQTFRPGTDPGAGAGSDFVEQGGRLGPNADYDSFEGRYLATGISDLSGAGGNEWPGLRSVGEVLGVRYRDASGGGKDRRVNIDFQGHNTDQDSDLGLSSLTYRRMGSIAPGATPGAPTNDGVTNDYAEQTQNAAGVLGAGTTRSDVFACWFVLAGFTPQDVNYVGDSDPLVPSVERRFLMIVDRSNVVRKGDKPRILYYKEVPPK